MNYRNKALITSIITILLTFNLTSVAISKPTLLLNTEINSNTLDLYLSKDLNQLTNTNINNFNIYSPTDKLVLIDTKKQKLYVFNGSSGNWNLEREFICATGLPETETPKGIFSCNYRGDWFFSNKFNKGAKYYINFVDCYYIHSVPLYSDQITVAESILGAPASHGCVRLSVEDSQWVYNNVTDGSTIVIP